MGARLGVRIYPPLGARQHSNHRTLHVKRTATCPRYHITTLERLVYAKQTFEIDSCKPYSCLWRDTPIRLGRCPCEVESCLGSKSRVGCAHPDNDFVCQESHERSVI
jgi:hypothetical protein